MTTRILVGDCRNVLRTLEHADTVITDPVWPNVPEGLLPGWERPEALFAEAMVLLPKSVKRLVVILRSDSDPRFLRAVPERWPFICMQALVYAVPMYLGRVLGGTEIAYGFGKPIPVREGKRVIPTWGPKAQPRDRPANGHPCSRSIVHMTWLVDWWSEKGDTILDPFCGSGTIPLAASHMQRHGIGIEIDPAYADMAERRIQYDAGMFAKLETA
jgi:site-specific DNA-methyltransferase (adenine-specific)